MVKSGGVQAAAELRQLRSELTVLSRIRHPNVVRLYGGSLTTRGSFLVEEYLQARARGTAHACRGTHPMPGGGTLHACMHAQGPNAQRPNQTRASPGGGGC